MTGRNAARHSLGWHFHNIAAFWVCRMAEHALRGHEEA